MNTLCKRLNKLKKKGEGSHRRGEAIFENLGLERSSQHKSSETPNYSTKPGSPSSSKIRPLVQSSTTKSERGLWSQEERSNRRKDSSSQIWLGKGAEGDKRAQGTAEKKGQGSGKEKVFTQAMKTRLGWDVRGKKRTVRRGKAHDFHERSKLKRV